MIFRLVTGIAGGLIICFALREIYEDLFHPSASGSLSGFVATRIAKVMHWRVSLLPSVGPLSLVAVILCWATLLVLGFGLIYWGYFPDHFHLNTGNSPSSETGPLTAFYFSLAMLSGATFGDIAPQTQWLRFLVTVEALLGLMLVTASVSWIVLLYPALGRMRTLARRTAILAASSEKTGIDVVSEGAEHLLSQLALDLVRTRVDLIHFPIIYYFYSSTEHSSLAHALPHLIHMADAGSKASGDNRLKLDAAVLGTALDDLAEVLRRRFVRSPSEDSGAVFHAYAVDHAIDAKTTN
ncbi:MAG TPA: ion channel [Bryobacteraceae bacterium]|nr:ion channel [Bryobacteraceae bacterium]